MPRLASLLLLALPVVAALRAEDATALLARASSLVQAEKFDAARPLLSAALRLQPNDPEILYQIAYVDFRQRRLAAARLKFKKVVNLAPPALYARYFLGRVCLLEGKAREAADWLEPAAASTEIVFDAAARLADAYIRSGRPEEALSPLEIAIRQAPWDGSLYYRLGRLHQQANRAALAREAFDNSRRLQSSNRGDVEALMQVSRSLAGSDAPSAAQTGAAIVARPDADPAILNALGVLYGAALPDHALQAFNGASVRDPTFFQAHWNHGLALLKVNRPAEAIPPLERASDLLPQSFDANLTLGLAYILEKRYADAVRPLAQAWRLDGAHVRTGSLLATARLRTGAAAQAIPILEQCTQLAPTDPAPLFLLIEAQSAAGQNQAALDSARLAAQRFPNRPEPFLAQAQQAVLAGDYPQARQAFERVLQLAPGSPEAELGLADALQRTGDHSAALSHYRTAAEAAATSLPAGIGLARSLIGLRHFNEARQSLESLLPLHPGSIPLRLELSRVYARLGLNELAAEQTRILGELRAASPQ